MGRALVRDPALFLFDEPLSNLDAKLRVEMRTEIKKLYQRLGKTTIYVTHDQVEAMTLASRIAVMHQGRLQQFAEPRTVYDRPANMFVAGFMGSPSMNFLPAQIAVSGPPAVVLGESERQATRLPLSEEVATSAGGDRRVVLGIRPENLTRYDRRRAEEKPYLGTIEAPVEVVEPTGAEIMVILRIGSREVIARFEPDAAPSVGETVTLAVDMTKACFFDPETEMLIQPASRTNP
jgi:multiple sugar transport system ATP-binding protein